MYVIFNQTLQLQPINTRDFFFYKFSKCEKDLIFRMSNYKNANAGNIPGHLCDHVYLFVIRREGHILTPQLRVDQELLYFFVQSML